MERGERALARSAAGEPAAIAALAHVGALGAVREDLVELRVAEAVAAAAGEAFVFDEGRLVGFRLGGFDDQPVFSAAAGPINGMRMAAAASGKEPGCDFAGWRER
jgi:hypothetical protein